MSKTEIFKNDNVSTTVKYTTGLTVTAKNTSFAIYKNQSPVGFWRLSDNPMSYCIVMYSKPTDEQIANTEKLLGWKWEDAK